MVWGRQDRVAVPVRYQRAMPRPNGKGGFKETAPFSPLFIGGAEGDRTPDLYNAIVALSQLSYGPENLVMPDGSGRSGALLC